MCACVYVTGVQVKRKKKTVSTIKRDRKNEATWYTDNTIDRLEAMFFYIHIQLLLAFSLHKILSPATCRFSQKSYFETTAALSPILNGCWL